MDPILFHDEDAFLGQYGDLKDAFHVHQLQSVIEPFMLRRLKERVEKSLPSKEETLIEVPFAIVYDFFLN